MSIVQVHSDTFKKRCEALVEAIGPHVSVDMVAQFRSDNDSEMVKGLRMAIKAEGLVAAAQNAADKLYTLAQDFSSQRFTDRYGDGPACRNIAAKLQLAINEVLQD